MKKQLLLTMVMVMLLAGAFAAGNRVSHHSETNPADTRTPAVEVSVEADSDDDLDIDIFSLSPGTVNIAPDKQQMIGVRTEVVGKAAVTHFLRTVGWVAADEKRVYRLVAGTDGWIRETYENDTGTLVKKDERLASFYSPLFRTTQYNYLSVLGSPLTNRYDVGRRQALAPSQLSTLDIKTYIDALQSLGMSDLQMEELARTKKVTDDVYILAPATGFIIARNVSPGQQFEKGFEWYQVADLERVWVLADLFPVEAGQTKPGMTARVFLPDQKKEFPATVAEVLPVFDANTRTLKVRLELDNPDYILRPDMFVDVEFPFTLPPTLTVPDDAILDSGLKKTVFIDRGNGFFEPREVETGRRFGNRVEVIEGLTEGERIVVSGNFLIDSESKMQLAAEGMYQNMSKDPVSGVDVSVNKAHKAGRKFRFREKTYYFTSEETMQQFQKEPEKYVIE